MADRHRDVEPTLWFHQPPPPNTPPQSAIPCSERKWCVTYYRTPKGNKYEMGGKYTFQYFLSQLNHWVIILYITAGIREPILCLALKLLLNSRKRFKFHFHFRDSRSHVLSLYYEAAVLTTHFTWLDVFQWCWGSANHSPWSSVISPHSVYVVCEILCIVI